MVYLTKAEYIYQMLKDDIIDGSLKAGERIVISDVTAKYKVSPMPVREAITKLEKYGYVEMEPHIGARVSAMDFNKIKEIILLRTEIEPLVAKLAVPYIDDKLISVLEKLLEDMEQEMNLGNKSAYEKLNKEFHNKIYEKNPYPYINELATELWSRSEVSKMIFSKVSDRMQNSLAEHKLWLQAIKNRDAEEVSRIVKKHKVNAFKELIELIDERE
ncbi:GntR family transcriptional regulator [Sinanaerobacter chloroacetimidivorans]|jgi:DNA-binding GntR family transcriptional regulator|uniref:GntR family transcriptional regulator n=1 Tax=Sinanaerobacter chloroacetimidivorans TaxID=2818044 RepID=A0A8J7VYV6_9FIRM|nr:GntR family transcriptional regulator [Sinanaerobacter chloroacetimidivorans]MBR0596548.1 GntR family transcriptional regulator [Sinanaerobacter chloroacetimidivorans]